MQLPHMVLYVANLILLLYTRLREPLLSIPNIAVLICAIFICAIPTLADSYLRNWNLCNSYLYFNDIAFPICAVSMQYLFIQELESSYVYYSECAILLHECFF